MKVKFKKFNFTTELRCGEQLKNEHISSLLFDIINKW